MTKLGKEVHETLIMETKSQLLQSFTIELTLETTHTIHSSTKSKIQTFRNS